MKDQKIPLHRIVGIVIVIALVLLFSILGSAIIYRDVIKKHQKTDAFLEVEEVYFILLPSEKGGYRLSVTTFITNTGEKDCVSKLRGFGIDKKTNLAMDDIEIGIGTIPAGKTVEFSSEMEFEKNVTYRIDLIIFKDGLISVKGLGYVNLAHQGAGGKDYQTIEYDSGDPPDERKGLPFPGIALLITAAFLTAALFAAARRRRWSQ